jgi:hypothetical protein
MEELQQLHNEAATLPDVARSLTVSCDEDYARAGEFIVGCKALAKKINDAHQANIDRWHQGHKAAIGDRDAYLKPITLAIAKASDVALVYKREQDRLAREEAERLEKERRAKIEEDRLKEAERLEAEGKSEEASKVIEQPIITRQVKYESPVPKVSGLTTRAKWKAKLVNPRLVNRSFCSPDMTLIQLYIDAFFPKGTPAEKKVLSDVQRKAIEEHVGGIELYLDEGFAGTGT